MELSGYASDRLNGALDSIAGEGSETVRGVATVLGRDTDGTVWVRLAGSGERTPLTDWTASLMVGDTCSVDSSGLGLVAVGNYSDPAVGEKYAKQKIVEPAVRPVRKAAVEAEKAASEAKAVAEAVNQHFWDDSNGAHVTDVTRDEWARAVDDGFSDLSDEKQYSNVLLNALGFLLRSALNNLVSLTRSAVAFFDGAGNTAANITAQFGLDGARIGKQDAARVELTPGNFQVVTSSNVVAVDVSGDGADMTSVTILPSETREIVMPTTGTYTTEAAPSGVSVANLYLKHSASGQVSWSANTQDLSANKTWTLPYNMTLSWSASTRVFTLVRGTYSTMVDSVRMTFSANNFGVTDTVSSPTYLFGNGSASGGYAMAQGYNTEAAYDMQAVFGRYNENKSTNLFEVGNGTANASSNAFEVAEDGTIATGNDIPWTNLALVSSYVTAYSTTPPKYRRWGNVVQVTGEVKPVSAISITSASDTWTIGILPADCCPSQELRVMCHGSGTAQWLMRIGTNGLITGERYRVGTAYQDLTTSTWLPFDCTFLV